MIHQNTFHIIAETSGILPVMRSFLYEETAEKPLGTKNRTMLRIVIVLWRATMLYRVEIGSMEMHQLLHLTANKTFFNW
jgi:hypothetical protein